jgi:HSP20 family protein
MLMNHSLLHTKEHYVYPGEYHLLPETEALLNELQQPGKVSTASPLVNMDEFADCFMIEMVVPGVQREEIIINVQENILSVRILHKNYGVLQNKKLQIHEFDSGSFERHLFLPENADPEFIIAEYRQGILNLYVPKTNAPSKSIVSQIVVY